MKAISVYIKEFGRVKDSQLEVLPFIIFSGKSGSGKSYMALLCHYFYEILTNSTRLSRFFERDEYDYQKLSKNFRNEGTALEIKKETLENWLAKDAISYVGAMIGNTSFNGSIKVGIPDVVPDVLRFRFKEEMTGLVNQEDVDTILSMEHLSYRVTSTTLAAESPFSFLLRYELIQYLYEDFRRLSRSFVFPPSRGPVLTESLTPQTGLYLQFLQDLNELNLMTNLEENDSEDLLKLFYSILDGDIKRVDSKYIYQTKTTEIPISAAAASIREIAPLELLVKKIDIATASVLFEEPEAHLHPLKQRMMADILSIFAQKGTFMQITTHSDYLIRRLNELVSLNELKKRMQDENKFNDFCKEVGILPELSLDIEKLTAYTMESREDGFTSVKLQELALGKEIPYRTFSEAISESMRIQNKLEEALENDC